MATIQTHERRFPLVSVIIPNYNHARFLDQRLQSVLNQTYRNIEVIILDDCSTDNSLEVIEKYRSDARIVDVIVNEKNSGNTFLQWKKGFDIAKGELLWIAESDDYCDLSLLETSIKYWSQYPNCSVVQCASQYVDEFGNLISNCQNCSGTIEYENGRDAIRSHMVCSNLYIPNASAVTFRKRTALSIPSNYKEYKSSGDRLFWIYMLEKGDLCTIGVPMNMYRQHTNNRVSNKMESCGIQCKENYFINQYLHKRGYVTGRLRLVEYDYYWNYINTFRFEGENTRKELLKLWFPHTFLHKICRRLISCVSKIKAFCLTRNN